MEFLPFGQAGQRALPFIFCPGNVLMCQHPPTCDSWGLALFPSITQYPRIFDFYV